MPKGICVVCDVLGIRGDSTGLSFDTPDAVSVTRQSFAADADINTIMRRYPNGGVPLDSFMQGEPIFGDFSDVTDFANMANRVLQARENFMLLPAALRSRFDNNVEKLLDFIHLPENVLEAVQLKLLPESMIEATFAVRPDLRPKEGEYSLTAIAEASKKSSTPTPPSVAS